MKPGTQFKIKEKNGKKYLVEHKSNVFGPINTKHPKFSWPFKNDKRTDK